MIDLIAIKHFMNQDQEAVNIKYLFGFYVFFFKDDIRGTIGKIPNYLLLAK